MMHNTYNTRANMRYSRSCPGAHSESTPCRGGYAERNADTCRITKDEYRTPGTKTGTKLENRNRTEWCQMRKKLQALYFVVVELELYLDTHPDNCAALARYQCVVKEYNELLEEYETLYGPITASGNRCTNEWQWVKSPWPWEV